MSLQVQLRAPGVPVAAPRRGRAPAGRLAVVASGSREQAAHAVVVGSLSALLAGAPLLDASAAFAAVATPDAIAAAEKEGEARLKSCTTDECRSVITALNAKKMAKLTGQPAPSVRAVAPAKKAAPAAAAKPAAPTVATPPKPASLAAPKAVAPTAAGKPAASKEAAAAAAAAKKKKEEAAKKAAAEKKKQQQAKKSGGGSNPLLFTISYFGKLAFAAGALAAPFIYLKKEEVILDESGAISTEKALNTLSGAATGLVDSVPNKDTVILYGVGALVALGVTDGIINLPLLNILIGAPVQILGFVTALALGVRYLKEGGDVTSDAKGLAVKLNGLVPEGLPKPLTPELESQFKR